jgi:transposase
VDVVVERCAGLDVHRDNVVATVRFPSEDRRRSELTTRTFKATLAGLAELATWLAGFGVTLLGMESTGVYWKTVFYALEDCCECWLLNAQHLRNVPGRKTDVKDSEWICQLVAHGLVRPSFVPPPEIRRLRDFTRLRKGQINERTRAIQRLEKVLQDAGIKLTSVASGTYSKSARAMLEALLSGVSDPERLAELAKGRMRSKIPQLREALASRFNVDHHGILVAQLLVHIDTLDLAVATLDEKIEAMLAPHQQIVKLLCTIPGVALRTAQVLIAECGLDMSQFPTAGHLASWAGICPGHHESAGRRRSGRTRPGPMWLTEALTESAKAAARTKGTYLAAHHAQLRGRRGEAKAVGATRHDILVAYYYIVCDLVPFRELGPDWLRRRYSPEHRARRLQAQLEALGYTVTLEQNSPSRRPPQPPEPSQPQPIYRHRLAGANAPCPNALATRRIHISAAVGAQRLLATGASACDPGDQLLKEAQHPALRVRGALAQADVQHLTRARSAGEDRMQTAHPGVAEARALLVIAVDLADETIDVDQQPPVARARAGLPRPRKRAVEHPVQLAHVAEGKRAQKRAQRRRRGHPTQQPIGPPSPQHVGVIDAVSANHHREDQRHDLAARVLPPRPVARQHHAVCDQRFDPQPVCQRRDQRDPRVSDDPFVVEGGSHPVQSDGPVIVHHLGDLLTRAPAAGNSLEKPAVCHER